MEQIASSGLIDLLTKKSIMFDDLLKEFYGALSEIDSTQQEKLKWAEATNELCRKTLTLMKRRVDKFDFKDVSEEIHFFKNVKSVPMSYLLYSREIADYEIGRPSIGLELNKSFIEKKVLKIEKFLHLNRAFINFVSSNEPAVDRQFFTRNPETKMPSNDLSDHYQLPEFSTSHDVLWARILALQRFSQYLKDAWRTLGHGGDHFQANLPSLYWSGAKTGLVELIYALHTGGYINHGTADISEVKAGFEKTFNVKLPNIYKTYTEIKARKGNRTKYLQELINFLETKMNWDDENSSE